ncbi:peptide-methionine (S)-S-oxide reductase MsrA [Paenibacillus beijingensis]|uniref:Peptide methionine sulfoxide reductase MsrA n=1 Tax=Paenibacillus beijingensis TaxID=1126833 RepID=A0A0D5NG50_9BACL|nr:peptide-methionine (S)-S-oxide reductase MsrA [Paenibacillus beijingensis]AJY74364.1 peptide methionine sulfoxide reductase [Paenibacillus beijingensis]
MNEGNLQTVTLGMGCFWSPDALFGHLTGVIRTRTGYAGGTSADPTYRGMGDHSETVEIDFDPGRIGLARILEVFWNHHNPVNINHYKGSQYRSVVFYRDEEQLEIIRQVKKQMERGKGELETGIEPFSRFHPAEDKHQKYYLKRHPDALEKLSGLYPAHGDLIRSTLAARLNGLAKGYTNRGLILNEISEWPISPDRRETMTDLVKQIRW